MSPLELQLPDSLAQLPGQRRQVIAGRCRIDGLPHRVLGDIANAHHRPVHLLRHLTLLLGRHRDLRIAFTHLRHRAGDFRQRRAGFLRLLHAVVGLERALLHEVHRIPGTGLQRGHHHG